MSRKMRNIMYLAVAALALCLVSACLALRWSGDPEGQVTIPAGEYREYVRYAAIGQLAEKIASEYYSDAPSVGELMAGAARGMVNTIGDTYARYYTAEEYDEYLSGINGEYFGLGMLLAQPDGRGAEVVEVYSGSPAEEAGIISGDLIVAVSGRPAAGMDMSELQYAIAREQETGVELTVSRGEMSRTVILSGAEIQADHVEHSLFNQRTGYISISMFTGNCAGEFRDALADLTERGMASLVIDLRDNPGGSLEAVVDIADALLGKGMRIVSIGREGDVDKIVYEANGDSIGVPVAVLVNERSASASEILAASLQENGVGTVVGTRTYGKGVVQTTMYLEAMGGWLKLTTDSYYTPNGKNIDGTGITPDIYSELPQDYKAVSLKDISQADDTQLWDALNYVRGEAD